MKIYSIFLILIIFFSGCAHKSAFDEFHLTKKEQIAQEQTVTGKMYNGGKVNGFVEVLYLNNVDREKFYNDEYFYISLFVHDSLKKEPKFLLNSQPPIEIEKLSLSNRFTKLTSLSLEWMDYYLIKFPKENQTELKLEIKENNSTSGVLLFKREY